MRKEHDEDNDDAYGEIGANSRWRSAHDEDNHGTVEAYSSNGSRDNNPVHSNYATIAYLLSQGVEQGGEEVDTNGRG